MEGAVHVTGQLCGGKECPFSGGTKSGRVCGTVSVLAHLLNATAFLMFDLWLHEKTSGMEVVGLCAPVGK